MKKAVTILILTVGLLFFGGMADAQTTIYINSTSGNDATGNGTPGSPYRSFGKGYNMAIAGDILDLTGTFTWTDTDETGDAVTSGYTIAKNLTIQGQGADKTVVQAAASAGGNYSRIFTISNGTSAETGFTVTIKNLEIKNGYLSSSNDGGAINSSWATVTIMNCYIHNNQARQGFAIEAAYTNLIITNSTISNNSYNPSSTGYASGAINLQTSSDKTYGINISNSTICYNTGANYGGGISTSYGVHYVTNCTFAYNSCYAEGAAMSVSGNSGGVHGILYLKNTIMANNTSSSTPAAADYDDAYGGTTNDNGYNIIEFHNSPTLTGTGTVTGDQVNLNLSATLSANSTVVGTPTLALNASSIAINNGNATANGTVAVPTTDQRGFGRAGNVDKGAYEYGAVVPNSAPTDISLTATSVNENVLANANVGVFSTTDPDAGNTFTYTLVAGTGSTDNAAFNISGSNLNITNSPDFEIKSSYSIRIRTTDQGSLWFEKVFTITVLNVNETPTDIALSSTSVNENVLANSTIGNFTSTDPDAGNTFTYTLVAGTGSTDNAAFNISGSNLNITNSPDFETKSSYSIRIRTTDQGSLWFEKVFTITVLSVNETPTDIALSSTSVNENVLANSTIGNFTSTDPDAGNTFTYTLVAGTGSTDNAAFNISGSNLNITNSPDFEIKSSYSIRIRTTDQGSLWFEKVFTITVLNVNETPTDIALSSTSVNENVLANSTIGNFTSTDPDAGNTFTYTLVAGTGSTDNAAFNISGSNLNITNSPDFETKSSYSIRIRSTDQGSLWFEKVFTITVLDVNETPTDIALSSTSVNENVLANSTIGNFTSTDPDAGNTFTYTLVAGTGSTDNAAFNISGSNLNITNSPDFETKSSYSIRIRTTDQGSLWFEKVFTITILNIGELAVVTTQAVSGIGVNSATGNGTIGDFGDSSPLAHGVCWNTSGTPTLLDDYTDNGATSTAGAYTAAMNGLIANTTYYARAYVTNTSGTSYGDDVVFTTGRVQLTIAAPTLTSKEYDGTDNAVSVTTMGSVTGIAGGDDVTVNIVSALFDTKDVGTGKTVTVTYDLSGTDIADYLAPVASVLTTGEITTKVITITGLTASNKDYDGNTDASLSGGMLDGVISPDDVAAAMPTTGTFADQNIGLGIGVSIANITLSGDDISNYSLTQPTGLTADITAKELTIGGSFTASDKEYDGTTDATILTNSLTLIGVVPSEDVVLNPVAEFASAGIATNILVSLGSSTSISGTDDGNYTLSLVGAPTTLASISPVSGLNEISNKVLSVFPNPFTDRVYLSKAENVTSIEVTNVAGQILIAKKVDGETMINTTELSSGVYFITVYLYSNEKLVYKMVK